MQNLGFCIEIRDFLSDNSNEQNIQDLLKKNNQPFQDQTHKTYVRQRKRTIIFDQKRFQKREQASFLAKTYLDFNGCTPVYNSQKRIPKKKIEHKNTILNLMKQSAQLQKFKMSTSMNQHYENRYRQIIQNSQLKRSAKSAAYRDMNFKVSIQTSMNKQHKQLFSRKMSSTAKKIQHSETPQPFSSNFRHLKSGGFIKNTKTFINTPQSKCLTKILCLNKYTPYKQNTYSISLKWTDRQNLQEYKNLQREELKYYNHIKSNCLISKYGIFKVYKQLNEQNYKPYQYIPRMYSIKQSEQYVHDYQLNAVLILLDKHIQYCRSKEPMFHNLQKLHLIKIKKNIIEQNLQHFIEQKRYLSQNKDQHFVINISMCLNMFKVLQQQRYKRFDTHKQIKFDNKILKSLLKYSKLAPSYDQYSKNQFSNLHHQCQYDIKQRQSKWQTPSKQLIMKLLFYKSYFQKTYPQGWNNLWILKSVKTNQEILTKECVTLDKQTIICKYIQNIWTVNNDNSRLEVNQLFGKKFEIIQTILIQSVQPLIFYSLSECAYKVIDDNVQSLFYQDEKSWRQSKYLYQSQFLNEITKLQPDFQHKSIKNTINTYIKNIIKVASFHMSHIKGSFQLLNFHIQLDQNKHPWIVNITKSSYLQKRMFTMKDYIYGVFFNTIKIVMQKDNLKGGQFNNNYHFIEIIKNKHRQLNQQIWIQVYGRKLNLISNKTLNQDTSQMSETKAVVNIQRMIRNFLSKK